MLDDSILRERRERRNAAQRRRRSANPYYERDRQRARRKTEKYAEWKNSYYARPEVKEARKASCKRQYWNHREKNLTRAREWYRTPEGKQYRRDYQKRWRAANPEKVREYELRKNAKRKAKRARNRLPVDRNLDAVFVGLT